MCSSDLGQHFLTNENICKQIVAVLKERPENLQQVLEVGPGAGAPDQVFAGLAHSTIQGS